MRNRVRRAWVVVLAVPLAIGLSSSLAWSDPCGDFVVDQSCETQNGGLNIMYAAPYGFGFYPETTSIEFIQLRTTDCSAYGQDAELVAHVHEGDIYGSILGTSGVIGLPAGHYYDYGACLQFDPPVALEPGSLYSIELVVPTGVVCAGRNPNYNNCPDSYEIFRGGPQPNGDVWFLEGSSQQVPVEKTTWGVVKSLYRP